MTSEEKFEFVIESWNAMLAGSRIEATRTARELKHGKITVNEFIARIDENEKRVLHILSFITLLSFNLGLSGESEPFLSVSKSEKEYSEFLFNLVNGLRPTERDVSDALRFIE